MREICRLRRQMFEPLRLRRGRVRGDAFAIILGEVDSRGRDRRLSIA